MKHLLEALLLSLIVVSMSCSSTDDKESNKTRGNDQQKEQETSFKPQKSDQKAIAIADSVIQAMGGQKAWQNTRYLQWNFFGKRELLWDKQTDRIKIYVPQKTMTINVDLQADTGNLYKRGELVTEQDSVERYLQQGKQIWANDSYWLFMPFKLKDPGVQLSYLREDSLENGQQVDVLNVTFNEVGFTPQNKYHLYIDQDSHLVRKWAYFQKADQTEPSMVTPWTKYKRYGKLRLSSGRGKFELSNIEVYHSVPEKVFSKAGPYRP